MTLPPAPTRGNYRRLRFLPIFAAGWSFIARRVQAEIRAENCWRQPRGMLFCHMPISQADYLTEPIDRGRE